MGFWESFVWENAILTSPAVLAALSSFFLFVLLRIDGICRDDSTNVRYFFRNKPRLILYLGFFSILCFFYVQPMFAYFGGILEHFDLNDLIIFRAYGHYYMKLAFALFILNYPILLHNLFYSVLLVWQLNETELLKSSQKSNMNLCYLFLLFFSILLILFHVIFLGTD